MNPQVFKGQLFRYTLAALLLVAVLGAGIVLGHRATPAIQQDKTRPAAQTAEAKTTGAATDANATTPTPAPKDAGPVTVAILEFENASEDQSLAPLSKGLRDMMTTDLSAVSSLKLVERARLNEVMDEFKLSEGKFIDPATAAKLGKGLAAKAVLTGSYLVLGNSARIDTRMVKVETGEVMLAEKSSGAKDDFFTLQKQLSEKLVARLDVRATAAEQVALKQVRTNNFAAFDAYSRGVDDFEAGRMDQSQGFLRTAVTLDPNFKLASDRYADVMRALEAAKQARRAELSVTERELLADINAELAKPPPRQLWDSPAHCAQFFPYRILRSQFYLVRLGDTLMGPPVNYRPALDAYIASQIELANLIKDHDMNHYGWSDFEASERDRKLGDELGMDKAGNYSFLSSDVVLKDAADLLLRGMPIYFDKIKLPRKVCFAKLDKAYEKLGFELLDDALADIPKVEKEASNVQSRSVMIYEAQAEGYVAIGKPERAIISLQTAMERFPKSDRFDYEEGRLKEILAGENLNLGLDSQ